MKKNDTTPQYLTQEKRFLESRNTLKQFLAQAAQHKAGATRPVAVAAPSAAAQQARAAMIDATRARTLSQMSARTRPQQQECNEQ